MTVTTPTPTHPPQLPRELWEAEGHQVRQRRGAPPAGPGQPPGQVGLAFSGGGIRSATLSLGILQALARLDLLKFVDFLSTVSGGGYAGTFLGGLHQRWKVKPGAPPAARREDWERVRAALTDRRGHPVDWLRENGRYLAPNGAGDLSVAAAVVIRNLAAVHVVLFASFLALFLTINGLRRAVTILVERWDWLAAWFNHFLVRSSSWWSPVLVLATAAFVAWVVPLGIAYWLVPGETDSLGREAPGARDGSVTRNSLTLRLRTALVATTVLALFGLLDSLGQTLFVAVEQGTLLKGMGALGATLASVAAVGQRAAGALGERSGKAPPVPLMLVAALLALALVTALLGGTSAVAHWLTWTNPSRGALAVELDPARYFIALGAAWFLAVLFGRTYTFVNGSSLAALYDGRLARAYLGASNVERTEPEKQALSVQLTGDDLRLADYRPHATGGPLHLINVTINETTGGRSQVEQRDRKGLGMTVGPAGVSVGVRHHATWVLDPRSGLPTGALQGTGEPEGSFRVFPAGPPVTPHWPTVGRWMAISGAAVSTGLGSRTSLSLSLLIGLLNFRLGQWWRSGVDPSRRPLRSRSPSRLSRWLSRVAVQFPVQAHLVNELLARFPGTSSRDWYLTDGGHFENTAAYELIRRRLPTIVVCDHGADAARTFEDLAILIRKVRIDLGAQVRFLTAGELAKLPGGGEGGVLGTLGELAFAEAEAPAPAPRRYAALARISYEGSEETSTLLWLRPAVLGTEPADVLGYHATNPDFPQQSTADQFFDEAQWESYRRLGERIGEAVFSRLRPPAGAKDPADGWLPFG
jgi:hypothetical protein